MTQQKGKTDVKVHPRYEGMFKHNTLKEMQQVEAHDKGDNLNGKKKRGRKPDANHLTKARKRIQTLRQEYKVR